MKVNCALKISMIWFSWILQFSAHVFTHQNKIFCNKKNRVFIILWDLATNCLEKKALIFTVICTKEQGIMLRRSSTRLNNEHCHVKIYKVNSVLQGDKVALLHGIVFNWSSHVIVIETLKLNPWFFVFHSWLNTFSNSYRYSSMCVNSV